jgi:DNA-binding SARP family transcriptional activator
MIESFHLFPQLDRLLRRIEAADAPLVQVWAWPGSGGPALLDAFLGRQGRDAVGLPLADFADEGAVRQAVEKAHAAGARWLVASGEPGGRLSEIESWLRPGQRLVFAGPRRWSEAALPLSVVAPQELLLTQQEVAALWHLSTGIELDASSARDLRAASDGWFQPLRLALDATGGLGLENAGPEQILEIPPVRFFLRHEVLEAFSEEERDLLLSAPDERPASGEVGEDVWRLLDSRGLWVEGTEGDRLPRLLAAALDRERRRRGRRAPAAPPPSPPEGSAGEPVYVLGLLGSPLARQRDAEGERDLDCRLKRSFQVLAYLASSPGLQAGREELIEAVWPTEGERTIERNFHPTLSHLRRALEAGRKDSGSSPLLFRSGVYRLNPEIRWEIDVIDFARRIDEGKGLSEGGQPEAAAEALRAAWKLYRGPFLQGNYETWVAVRREHYQRLYLDLLRDLGDLYLRLERLEEAMDAYRSVLLEDPLQERVHAAVMRIYATQGRRDLVRRQYDKLSNLLLEELGLAPSLDTTREYHRLME